MATLELQRHSQTALDNLEPGDLLEFKRGAYSHWAVYIGDEEVVHMLCTGIVCKVNIWSVEGDSKVYKNNSEDAKLRHFEPSEIVQRALSIVDEVRCNFKNCKSFALWCRYYTETQRHNQREFDNLERGDLLQFKRVLFSHWAVYVGDNDVVHLTVIDGAGGSDLSLSCTTCGVDSDKGIVRKDGFFKVAGDCKAYKNNSKDSKLEPLKPDEIVQRTLSGVGKVPYHLLCKNCEHFATWCRYDKEESDQAKGLFAAAAAVFFGGAAVVLIALFGRG